MKKIIACCAILLSFAMSAQTAPQPSAKIGTVKGKVIDQKLQQPIPYASVVIKTKADNATVTGGITDEKGEFTIKDVGEGSLIFQVQFVGYKTYSRDITISRSNRTINVGTIQLEEDVAQLEGVEVVAERSTIEQKVDRKVINVGKDLTTSGPTASDIMNNLPSVSVDQQTGDLSMRGNQNVRVMVDGKLSNIPTAQLLKQIPSTSIKSIELITNPSAKYNPEGMSGIINIILHKNTNIGFNGNANVGLTYQDEPKFNSSIDMNYRNGKVNLYGSYGNNISKNVNFGNIHRPDENSDQLFDFLDKRKSHLFKVGVDFYLNDKNTISVFTNQNLFDGGTSGRTRVVYRDDIARNTTQTFFNENDNSSQQYNFNYKLDFAKDGHNIELEVDHNIFDGESDTDNQFFLGTTRPNFFELNDTDRERTTINLDYVNPLSDKTKLELGLQAILFDNGINYRSDGRSQNELGEYIPTKTDFNYTRDIYSAYATFAKQFEKWSYQVGVRAENVQVDALAVEQDLEAQTERLVPFENEYFQLYPSAFITYNPGEKNSYQLSYSRRIDRPGIGQVNPLPEWNTPLISSFGNLELQPQFTNSVEVNYTRRLKKGSITTGVFYRIIEDEINRAVFIDRADLNRIILTFDNFDNTSAYGLEVSSNYRPTKWWSLNGSFDLYSQTQKSINERLTAPIETATEDDIVLETVEVDNVAWNFRVFNNFKVNKTLSLSAFGFYRGKNKGLQFDQKPMYFVNIGARVNFAKGKGTFSLNYNDIFDTMKFAFEGSRPFRQFGEFNWESNTISTSLSYRFGGGKYRAKSRKRRDNNEKSGGGGIF